GAARARRATDRRIRPATVQQQSRAGRQGARGRAVDSVQAPEGLGDDPPGRDRAGPGPSLGSHGGHPVSSGPHERPSSDRAPQGAFRFAATRRSFVGSGGRRTSSVNRSVERMNTWWKRLAVISMLAAGAAFAQTGGSTSGGTTGSGTSSTPST